MNIKRFLPLSIAVCSLLASCSSKENKKEEPDNTPPIVVKVSKVENESENGYLSTSGKVEAVQNATISTRSMGYVQKVYVEVGSHVKKGQLILSINNADLAAQKAQTNAGIAEAQAAFENAKKDYQRFQALYSSQSASQKELDDMTTRYNMAKARLDAARQVRKSVDAQLSYNNIRAPFSGIITQKMINSGDMATPGAPLLQMENPSRFQVVAMIPESDVSKVKKGEIAKVLIKSIHKTVEGNVTAVSASTSNGGGQYLAKIALPTKQDDVLSGMFATVQFPIKSSEKSTVVSIPSSALVKQGELTGIYTLSQSGTAILRWLRLGNTLGKYVEVLSGLSPGETYIVSADGKLYNGAKVSVQ